MPDEANGAMESWAVPGRPALWLTLGFFGLLAVVIALAWGFYRLDLPNPKLSRRHPFPSPDLELYLRHENARVPNPPPPSSYGWADQGHARIRMPIERAMQAVAEKGEQGWAPLEQEAPQ